MSFVKAILVSIFIGLVCRATAPGQTFTKITSGAVVTDVGASRGVTWVDYDKDGYLDLFVTNFSNGGNILYRNDGPPNFTFTKMSNLVISQGNAPSAGQSWGDYDNDGYPDAFVANWGGVNSFMYHNNGDGTFSPVASQPMVNEQAFSADPSWADFDNDGLLDLAVTNSGSPNTIFLYHNLGDGTFEKITTGDLATAIGPWFGVSWIDYDGDGDLDLWATHNGTGACALFKNMLKETGSATFTRVTTGSLVTTTGSSVGGTWGDYDNDGDLDLYVTNFNFATNFMYRNDGGGNFTRIDTGLIVNESGLNNSAMWIDADNDGDLDLFVTHGWRGGATTNTLYKNMLMETGSPTFEKVTTGPLATDLGWSFGFSWGDYDEDGFPDVYVAKSFSSSQANALYHNDGNGNHWLKVDCIGTLSNRSAIGTIVRAKATIGGNAVWQMRAIEGQATLYGQNLQVQFGFGDAATIDSLLIAWPSGQSDVFTGVHTNQHLCVAERDSTPPSPLSPPNGGVNQLPAVSLRWRTDLCGKPFHLQLSTDSTFHTGMIVDDSTISDTARTVTFSVNGGKYFWRVQSSRSIHHSVWSQSSGFSNSIIPPAVPVPQLPANGSLNQSIVPPISWGSVPGAASYHFVMSTDSLSLQIVMDDSTLTTASAHPGPLLNSTLYYWKVNAKNFVGTGGYSSVQQFTTIVDTPLIPILVSPPDGSSHRPLNDTLSWSASPAASSYRVQLALDSLFSFPLVDAVDTATSIGVGPLSYFKKYFWRARASNIGGTSPYSSAFAFSTTLAPPSLLAPPDSADFQPTHLLFRWHSVTGADRYQLQIATDSLFSPMAVVDSTIADTSAAVDSLRNFTLYFWRVRAGDASGKGGWSAVSRVTVSLITRAYGVDPGWNLVSLPLLESDRVKNTLFPQAISPAFAYDSGSFVVSDTLENGRGYWMKFASALSVAISGASSTTETVSVAEGWNLIGALSAPIAAFSVTSLPAGIMTSYVFGFRGHYVLSDSIYPMRGYWVKSGQPGSIVLSTESPAMSLAKNADDEELKYASSFTFSDKTGARITLYLVPQMSGHVFRPDRYELPPAPRESVFDIRFASNRFAETVDPKCVAAMPVILRSTTPPVTLEWNVDAMNVSLETGGRRSSMTGSGKIQLNNGLSSLFLVTGVSPTLPVAFSVGQNYPNPFNPVTVIRYSVPVTREANVRQDPILSHISLKVYDMLGQLVATLVDDTKAPGEYTARWDASNAPSGIYYYRFVAGGFTDIKKMVYLK